MMLSLQSQYCAVWTSSTGDRLRFNSVARTEHVDLTLYVPWFVSLVDDEGAPTGHLAMIQAFKRGDRVQVFFRDGFIYNRGRLGAMVRNLGQERAIGPAFDRFVQEILHQMNVWAPLPIREDKSDPAPATHAGLDPLDHKIIEVVRQIEHEGRQATDTLVASRLPSNPRTDMSYHRVTISKRRNRMRDKGHKV